MNKYIWIETLGGIASGKTTFTSLFRSYNYDLIFEDFRKSPFWEAFYINPGKYIFETEMSFVLLHYHQIKKTTELDHKKVLYDFSFLLDLAYAKIGLSGSQLQAFECVLNEIKKELPEPTLYIYLECDAKTQLSRIKRRQRPEENMITIDFLESLNSALETEIQIIDSSKVIRINSAEKDFAHIKSVQDEMVASVKSKISNNL